MDNSSLAAKLRAIAAELVAAADYLESGAVSEPAAPAPADDAPFGRDLYGNPRAAPAYDACRPMWEAAQREGIFNIHDYIGQGIQQGAGQITTPHVTDWRAVEDAITGLGTSSWGKRWLAQGANAELIDQIYLQRFVGYTVKRRFDKDGNLSWERLS